MRRNFFSSCSDKRNRGKHTYYFAKGDFIHFLLFQRKSTKSDETIRSHFPFFRTVTLFKILIFVFFSKLFIVFKGSPFNILIFWHKIYSKKYDLSQFSPLKECFKILLFSLKLGILNIYLLIKFFIT